MPHQNMLRFALLCFCFVALQASAQDPNAGNSRSAKKSAKRERINQMLKAEEEGSMNFRKQWMMGPRLNSDGWSAFFEWGKQKTAYKANWYLIEFGEKKAINEEKTSAFASGIFLGRPLVYGKQNVFFQTKFGFGQQYLIGGKSNKNGVAVMAVYGGGLSLGLLKPYYIEKLDPRTNQVIDIRWQNDKSYTDTLFLDQSTQANSAGLFKGLNEIKIRPGVFAKTGLRFDWARFNETITALECGVNVEYYPQEIAIMVNNGTRRLFANFYVSLNFGRRR